VNKAITTGWGSLAITSDPLLAPSVSVAVFKPANTKPGCPLFIHNPATASPVSQQPRNLQNFPAPRPKAVSLETAEAGSPRTVPCRLWAHPTPVCWTKRRRFRKTPCGLRSFGAQGVHPVSTRSGRSNRKMFSVFEASYYGSIVLKWRLAFMDSSHPAPAAKGSGQMDVWTRLSCAATLTLTPSGHDAFC
jgi:hypothetical protein